MFTHICMPKLCATQNPVVVKERYEELVSQSAGTKHTYMSLKEGVHRIALCHLIGDYWGDMMKKVVRDVKLIQAYKILFEKPERK